LGLASSSPRRLIDSVLEAAGLTGSFRVTMSTEQVAEGKPSPLVYQAVTADLGAAPGAVVAIEDSSNGLRSASRAGLHVIAVPRPEFPPAPDALALADLVLDDLDEITPALVESLAS
jgi:beta-phosphoglucomutase-like phosphatase (HAD superfamily)